MPQKPFAETRPLPYFGGHPNGWDEKTKIVDVMSPLLIDVPNVEKHAYILDQASEIGDYEPEPGYPRFAAQLIEPDTQSEKTSAILDQSFLRKLLAKLF